MNFRQQNPAEFNNNNNNNNNNIIIKVKEYANSSQTHLMILLKRHVSTNTSLHQDIF